MTTRIVRIIIQGEDTVSSAADSAGRSLGTLGKVAKGIAAAGLIALAKQAISASADLVKLGASSLMARDRLNAFAGGSQNAAVLLNSLIQASDGTIDRLTATAQAARLAQMGIATTGKEMAAVGAIVGKLGDQTLSLETRMQTFTMMMANQSKLRLDTFGLSVERVTKRQAELEAQGYSTAEAFKIAVYEEAERAIEKLGDTSATAATKILRIEAAFKNVGLEFAETIAKLPIVQELLDELDWTAAELSLKRTQKELIAYSLLTKEQAALDLEAMEAGRGRFTVATVAIEDMTAKTKEYNAILERSNELTKWQMASYRDLMSLNVPAEIERQKQAYLDAAGALEILNEQIAARRRTEQLEDFTRRAVDIERSHQDNLARIIASGQQSQADVERAAYQNRLSAMNAFHAAQTNALRAQQQERMDALNDAMQAELAGVSSGQSSFHTTLENMRRAHLERLAALRDSAIESDRQAEDRRFRDVMNNLNAEQKARLDALKAKYGKDEDFDDQKLSLEEEHRRRMMGLYTEDARRKERERYEAALKELAYQEELAGLQEEFQGEKAAAEETHKAELERIRLEDIQRQIDEEKARYARAVEAAVKQEGLTAGAAAARNEITERYAKERAILEERDRAERESLEETHNAERKSLAETHKANMKAVRDAEILARINDENKAYGEQLADLGIARARVEQAYEDSYKRQELAHIEHLAELGAISEREAERMYLKMLYWTDPRDLPPGGEPGAVYAEGTPFHPGGLAIVGEEGPELLDLPRGTSVTPLAQIGAAGIVIHNYFGRDSVRTERDIYQIEEDQALSMRLRGVRSL